MRFLFATSGLFLLLQFDFTMVASQFRLGDAQAAGVRPAAAARIRSGARQSGTREAVRRERPLDQISSRQQARGREAALLRRTYLRTTNTRAQGTVESRRLREIFSSPSSARRYQFSIAARPASPHPALRTPAATRARAAEIFRFRTEKEISSGKTTIERIRGGNERMANRDFNNLELKNIREIRSRYGTGRMGTLSDNTNVLIRGSSDGRHTIEFQLGARRRKIRYG